MAAIWLLSVATLALLAAFALVLARRTRDETTDSVRSFDDFLQALSPRVSALRTSSDRLRDRLDRHQRRGGEEPTDAVEGGVAPRAVPPFRSRREAVRRP